jgi:CDGSH-type Zn-finger protein
VSALRRGERLALTETQRRIVEAEAEAPRVMAMPARITPYRDGPLLVRGPFRLTDQDGAEIAVGRETVALCRCGKSRIRPFCDGTHKSSRFSAPSGAEDRLARAALPAAARAARLSPRRHAVEQVAGPSGPRARRARALPTGSGRRARARGAARPPARSTAATFSCTASASTCSSKNPVARASKPSRRSALA